MHQGSSSQHWLLQGDKSHLSIIISCINYLLFDDNINLHTDFGPDKVRKYDFTLSCSKVTNIGYAKVTKDEMGQYQVSPVFIQHLPHKIISASLFRLRPSSN